MIAQSFWSVRVPIELISYVVEIWLQYLFAKNQTKQMNNK